MDESFTKPEGPEEQVRPDRGGSALWFVWALLLLLVIYPLSIGPAAWAIVKIPASAPPLRVVYRPIAYFTSHYPRCETALRWYLNKVWQLNIPPPPTATR